MCLQAITAMRGECDRKSQGDKVGGGGGERQRQQRDVNQTSQVFLPMQVMHWSERFVHAITLHTCLHITVSANGGCNCMTQSQTLQARCGRAKGGEGGGGLASRVALANWGVWSARSGGVWQARWGRKRG